MILNKRQTIYNKYQGKCAYTGTELKDDWQVYHIYPKFLHSYHNKEFNINDLSNLIPTQRIINHYKRALDLEGFRAYMLTFLNYLRPHTQRRKDYMYSIADLLV